MGADNFHTSALTRKEIMKHDDLNQAVKDKAFKQFSWFIVLAFTLFAGAIALVLK